MKDYEEFLSETIENATDNIITQLNKAYMYGHEQGKKSSCVCKDNVEAEYNRGLNEAWEFIQKLLKDACDGGYTVSLLQNALGYCNISDIVRHYDISEAIAKIKEYEEQQKQDTEIKVGDEVITKIGNKGIVITNVPSDEGMISVWVSTCTHVQLYPIKDLVKTGRHFDAIAEVLAEMRGKSE